MCESESVCECVCARECECVCEIDDSTPGRLEPELSRKRGAPLAELTPSTSLLFASRDLKA